MLLRFSVVVALLVLVALSGSPIDGGRGTVEAAQARQVKLTYYLPTGGRMASGEWPFQGAAACGYDMSMGTKVRFSDGREVVCLDRGHLGSGHIDVYAESHYEGKGLIAKYGTVTWVETDSD